VPAIGSCSARCFQIEGKEIMIICACRCLTDKQLRAAIMSGSLEKCLKKPVGVKMCGSCNSDIEKLCSKIRDEQSRLN
jgi:bacterioferritin-associated ferredoxin